MRAVRLPARPGNVAVRPVRTVGTLLVVALAGLPLPAGADARVTPDFAVLGAPDADGGRGALVVVRLEGKGRPRVYRAQDVGLAPSRRGDRFGAAVAAPDRSGDVVVGAPGRDHDRGAVYLVRARPDGRLARTSADDPLFGRPDIPRRVPTARLARGSRPGDRFGAAVAVGLIRYRKRVWIGVPGAGRGRGEVIGRELADGRLRGRLARFRGGSADRRFGAVLVAAKGGALVGLPDADGPHGEPAAGAVVTLPLGGRRTRIHLPGANAGDRFGAALASYDNAWSTVAGAPGADVAGAPDAGAVGVLADGRVRRTLTQADPIVLGDPVAGGRFGGVVATGFQFSDSTGIGLAIGAPGTGTVTVVDRPSSPTAPQDEPGEGSVATLPAGSELTGLAAVAPNYADEDAVDAILATDAAGGAYRPRFAGDAPTTALDTLTTPRHGRLVAPVRYWP